MRNHGHERAAAIKAITEQAVRILEMDCGRRTSTEHAFVVGLLSQRNAIKNRLCKNWPTHQFAMLCKKVKMIRIKPFRKVNYLSNQWIDSSNK